MAGRRRKNTVAGSKKESPKTQNTLQETNVSTDKEATKADVKKQAEDVNEKKTADAKIVEDKKVQTETKGRKPGSKNKPKEQLAPEVYLQYCGEEADQNAIIERIKEQYVSEGHRAGNIKSLKLYLKPEDRAAYYVINDRYAGKVDLF